MRCDLERIAATIRSGAREALDEQGATHVRVIVLLVDYSEEPAQISWAGDVGQDGVREVLEAAMWRVTPSVGDA